MSPAESPCYSLGLSDDVLCHDNANHFDIGISRKLEAVEMLIYGMDIRTGDRVHTPFGPYTVDYLYDDSDNAIVRVEGYYDNGDSVEDDIDYDTELEVYR